MTTRPHTIVPSAQDMHDLLYELDAIGLKIRPQVAEVLGGK